MTKLSIPFQILTLTILLCTLTYTTLCYAHDFEGNLTAQAGAGATDLFSISCSNAEENATETTHHLYVTIRNNVKSNDPLSVVVYKKGDSNGLSKSVSDAIGGDYTPSPGLLLPGGNGDYLVFVHHNSDTPLTYLLQYHCQDSNNQHTGTDIQSLQNE
ncbi:hypothetical protein [Methylomonas sp. AM2-LC]|uniref:hypothetical protein n=1 Tax=Methylomonas sp. AM2-LC TaxID=3153301 RepID=UPI0032649B52